MKRKGVSHKGAVEGDKLRSSRVKGQWTVKGKEEATLEKLLCGGGCTGNIFFSETGI